MITKELVAGLGALALAGGIFYAGTEVGRGWGKDDCTKKADVVIAAKNTDINTLNGDLGQCRAANANYHVSVGDQLRVIQADLRENIARQASADQKNAQADVRMLDAARKSAENSQAAREAILHAVNQCIRDGVPAEYVGMLNTILPRSNGTQPAGGDTVPSGKANN